MEPVRQLLLTALVTLLGSFIQSSSGFGYAIICMSFLPMIMPFVTASVLEVLTAFFMVAYLAFRLWRHIDWNLLLPPLLASSVFSFLGVSTLMSLSDIVLKRLLGAALLALAFYFVALYKRFRMKGSLVSGIAAGVIGGFMGGLFNIGGPPMVAYFLSASDDKQRYNATLQAFFFSNTILISLIHLFRGNVTPAMLPLGLAALGGTAAGTFSGFLLFKKLSLPGIRKFVWLFMAIAGLMLIVFT